MLLKTNGLPVSRKKVDVRQGCTHCKNNIDQVKREPALLAAKIYHIAVEGRLRGLGSDDIYEEEDDEGYVRADCPE